MKFKTFKILISIFALIQTCYSSSLENKSANTEKAQMKTEIKRSSFYESNGFKVNPPIKKIPVEEIPKKINQPLVPDPHAVKGEMTQILTDWQMISSEAFEDKGKFPDVFVTDTNSWYKIKLDNMKFRINDSHKNRKDEDKENLPHDKNCFWFRLSGLNLYYSSTRTDYNILGAIKIEEVIGVISLEGDHTGYHCYIVRDNYDTEWKICSASKAKRNLWVCTIQKELNVKQEPFCDGGFKEKIVVDHEIIQPLIVIPKQSRHCNEKWNYQNLGNDWECECKEGKEQSPIDLPKIRDAIDTEIKPIFHYDRIDPLSTLSTLDGRLENNKNIQIRLEDGAIRIKYIKFGKAVTLDGAVYHAEEIVFHTPSEHTIDGKQYDMEVQIIHYGQTKGDIAKQLTLSFLFESKAGVYNKFLDDIDFFNLPGQLSPRVDLNKEIYIPKIFYEATSLEEVQMKPFSFYTYQGSLTFPPCVEDTIVYVASKPLYIGTTALQLFTEALRIPDMMTQNGNVIVSDWLPNSRREIQELNGRPVFHYNHEKYCKDPKVTIPEKGHYEKIQKIATKYFYINNLTPSGIPNAFVVSEDEAKGIKSDKPKLR